MVIYKKYLRLSRRHIFFRRYLFIFVRFVDFFHDFLRLFFLSVSHSAFSLCTSFKQDNNDNNDSNDNNEHLNILLIMYIYQSKYSIL